MLEVTNTGLWSGRHSPIEWQIPEHSEGPDYVLKGEFDLKMNHRRAMISTHLVEEIAMHVSNSLI